MQHIGLVFNEVVNKWECEKCKSIEFKFSMSLNLDTEHRTVYNCNNCNYEVTVVTPKSEQEIECNNYFYDEEDDDFYDDEED